MPDLPDPQNETDQPDKDTPADADVEIYTSERLQEFLAEDILTPDLRGRTPEPGTPARLRGGDAHRDAAHAGGQEHLANSGKDRNSASVRVRPTVTVTTSGVQHAH